MTFRDLWLLLTFRLPEDRFDAFGARHLALGLTFTWLAGVGRYWDSPRAEWWQFAGLGSLAYVVVLDAILWIVIRPLTTHANFDYVHLLAFVALTSPPALLYAIPVERFCALATATTLNVWFLAVVALWRVALLAFYLRRGLALDWIRSVLALLLPLAAIIGALAALNLEHVVFRFMAGLRDDERSADDGAHAVVVLLHFIAMPLFLLTVIPWLGFVGAAFWKWCRRR